jgi:hypothetical protein
MLDAFFTLLGKVISVIIGLIYLFVCVFLVILIGSIAHGGFLIFIKYLSTF